MPPKTNNKQIVKVNFLFLVIFSSVAASAKSAEPEDSIMVANDTMVADTIVNADTLSFRPVQRKVDYLSQSRLFRSTYLGVPLVVGGLIEKHQDTKFRNLRNDFLPRFHRNIDNYMQFTPAAVMLGLKTLGVPSRSSWGRMLLSDAFAAGIATGVVQGLKHSTNIMRPDGSDNHSFPSGHTATAFMMATMLSKEYGHISPWISVGGYSVATATGLMRVANNKHWLSDVMVGAGIGILSTEFGYWIADLICKDKGLNIREVPAGYLGYRNPSFFGLYGGFNLPLSHFDVSEDVAYKMSTGTVLGAEGAWFVNNYIGIGGKVTISNVQFIVNGNTASDNSMDYYSFFVGPYFNLPLTPRWSIGTKALAQYTIYSSTNIGNVYVLRNKGWGFGTGLNIDYRVQKHLGVGIFLDYSIQPPHSQYSDEFVHTMTLGARATIRF